MKMQRAIYEVALRQHGLATRRDLELLGMTRDARRAAVASGALVRVGRQTFAVGGAPRTTRQRVMAACLDTGGCATRGTAAWLHGIDGFGPGAPPSVVVAKARSDYRTPLAEVHASTWLPVDDVVCVDGIPCLGVARTLFSLAAAVPSIGVEAVGLAVDVAIRDGKATDAWLWWHLERIRCRGRNGVAVFEALLVERAGGKVTESWLESEFLRIVTAAGLPIPRCQRRIERQGAFVARVDFIYEDLAVVIEVSGHTSHSTRAQRDADARRRNELALAGHLVIEFTYDDLVSDPAYVVAKILEILAERRRRPAA